MFFGLKRIFFRISNTQNNNFFSCDFYFLPTPLRSHQFSINRKACACRDKLQSFFFKKFAFCNYLNIINSRTIVKCNKRYMFAASFGTNQPLTLISCLLASVCNKLLILVRFMHFFYYGKDIKLNDFSRN